MPFAFTRRIGRAASLAIWILLAAGSVWGALEPAQVLILVNRDTGISARVTTVYQKLRAIPDENILRLSLGTERFLTPEQYFSKSRRADQEVPGGTPGHTVHPDYIRRSVRHSRGRR